MSEIVKHFEPGQKIQVELNGNWTDCRYYRLDSNEECHLVAVPNDLGIYGAHNLRKVADHEIRIAEVTECSLK